jgi:hypothetical protein
MLLTYKRFELQLKLLTQKQKGYVMQNTHLSTLMGKEISRREFLGMSGLALASIFGFGTFVKLLTGKSLSTNKHLASGYGSSPYGGK